MLFAVYPIYLLAIAGAVIRVRRTWIRAGSEIEWRIASLEMLVLPIAASLIIFTLAANNERPEIIIGVPLIPGFALLALGFFLAQRMPDIALQLRIAGWSLVAGLVLVPSSLVIFAPLIGLLAFPVIRQYKTALIVRDNANV